MHSVLSSLPRPLQPLNSVLGDCRGAAAIILAVALSGIVGFAGLGSEAAAWYFTTRAMQGAVDSAAATAAAELAAAKKIGGTVTCTQLRNEARSIAASSNFTNGTANTTVTVNGYDSAGTSCGAFSSTTNMKTCSTPFSAFNCYIEVVISQQQTPLLSAVIMGTSWQPTINTRAVALANTSASASGCVVALSKQSNAIDISVSGSVTMAFNNCALYDNSPLTSGALTLGSNVTITAKAAYISGGCNTSGCTGVTTDHPSGSQAYTGVNPITDPYASIASPSTLYTAGHCDQNGKYHPNNSATLTPPTGGVFVFCNDVQVDSSGVTLTLNPGIYILDGGNFSMTGGTLQATGGVTIVLTNHAVGGSPGTMTVGGNAIVNLTAPTTGATAGVAIYQDRVTCTANGNNTCTNSLAGGANQNITGAIYFPNNSLDYSGGSSTGSGCTQLIAYTITFTGGSTFNSTCTGTGAKEINNTNGTLVM